MLETREILKKVRHIEIKTKGLVNNVFSGEYHSVFKGRGMAFSEVREYQVGDDIRNIDWNVTARFNHPFVKVFEEERELTVILMVDISGSQFFGSSDYTKQQLAAEISAILAFSALKNNDKTGLILFTGEVEKFIPPKKTKLHILRIIRELLSYTPKEKNTNIKSALEFLNSTITKKSITFLISDFKDSGFEKVLKIASKKHDLVPILVRDEKEKIIPGVGLVQLIDPETGKLMTVDTSSKSFSDWLNKKESARLSKLETLFKQSGIEHINLLTSEEYIKPLTNFFKKRESRW